MTHRVPKNLFNHIVIMFCTASHLGLLNGDIHVDSKKLKAMAMSYFRAAFAAVAALYLSGITEPKILLNGFIAGLIGPAAKALDRSAKEYGLGAVASDVIKKAEADALAALAENSKKVAKKTTKSKK